MDRSSPRYITSKAEVALSNSNSEYRRVATVSLELAKLRNNTYALRPLVESGILYQKPPNSNSVKL